jgi:hypothetical protein
VVYATAAGTGLGVNVELMHPDCFLDVVSPPRTGHDQEIALPPATLD